MIEHPLVKLKSNLWAQLYFDKFTNKLSSVRFLDTETLLLLRPYELSYTNVLEQPPVLTDEERRNIEMGEEQEILDLSNVLRVRNDLSALVWNDDIAKVALLHSKDMKKHNYFS